jgi:energy-coupling factor transporter ATP-binding protein EcfA2
MNINIRIPESNEWTSSTQYITPSMRDAYASYKEDPEHLNYREKPYVSDDWIVYRPDNDPYLPTYIVRRSDASTERFPAINHQHIARDIHESMEDSQLVIPIIDINDIYVFLTDHPPNEPNWVSARSYQIWAYRDYVYDRNRSIKKSYMTRNTYPFVYQNDDNMLVNQMVTIDVANVPANIVFNIARNNNNSVYFERNNTARTRVRICDNQFARICFLGYYTRITMDPGMIVNYLPELLPIPSASPNLLSVTHLSALEETTDEENQCILCVRYRVNARFSPCEHQICCSDCYSKMSKNACPVCRAEITRVINV